MMGVSYESFISVQTENAKLETLNAELLEALELIKEDSSDPWAKQIAREAIRKAGVN